MPNSMYNEYNTPLTPEQRKGLYEYLLNMSLAEQRNRFNDMNDYDMAGAYINNLAQKGEDGFFYDIYKKPNHPVFSDDSQYNGVDGHYGGHWTDGTDEYPGGTFTPSEWNLKNMPAEEMQQYFDRFEPEAKLILPEDKNEDIRSGDSMTVKYQAGGGGGWNPFGFLSTLAAIIPGGQAVAPWLAGAGAVTSAVNGDIAGAAKQAAGAMASGLKTGGNPNEALGYDKFVPSTPDELTNQLRMNLSNLNPTAVSSIDQDKYNNLLLSYGLSDMGLTNRQRRNSLIGGI